MNKDMDDRIYRYKFIDLRISVLIESLKLICLIQESNHGFIQNLSDEDIKSMTDRQLYDLLSKRVHLRIGPVMFSTRKLYEKILRQARANPDELFFLQSRFGSGNRQQNKRVNGFNQQVKDEEEAIEEEEEEAIEEEEKEEDIENNRSPSSQLINQSARTSIEHNYSFVDEEASSEIGRQLRFGMSSTPIHGQKPTRLYEPKSVSFQYEEEEENDAAADDLATQAQYPKIRPLATETMHTLQPSLGPRPRPPRPIHRYTVEPILMQKKLEKPSNFFRNVCILAVVIMIVALIIAYKLQNV